MVCSAVLCCCVISIAPSLCLPGPALSARSARAGGSRYHLRRGFVFGHLTRCLIRSFLSHRGAAALPACEPHFALIVIEPRSFFSPNRREE